MDSFLQGMIGEKPQKPQHAPSSDLMSSAKVVAEAAQLTMRQETDKVDKGRVAGAAADLLDAGSNYGKLDEKGFGKYVKQAETYLHSYQSSNSSGGEGVQTQNPNTTSGQGHSKPQTHSSESKPEPEPEPEPESGHSKPQTHSSESKPEPEPEPEPESGSGSGFDDYFKMAEGFLKKH